MKIEFRKASVDRGDGAVLEAAMRAEVAAVCGGIRPGLQHIHRPASAVDSHHTPLADGIRSHGLRDR